MRGYRSTFVAVGNEVKIDHCIVLLLCATRAMLQENSRTRSPTYIRCYLINSVSALSVDSVKRDWKLFCSLSTNCDATLGEVKFR